MTDKKKILYLINDITMPGGLSRVTLNLIHEFCRLQGDLEVKAVSAAAKFNKVEHSHIDYLDMPALHGLSIFEKVKWYISLKANVEQYVDKQNYDVVIAVGTAMTLFSSFCKFKRTEVWGAEHLAHTHYGLLRRAFKRWRYPKLKRLICLTKSDKEKYYDSYLKNVSVIPNFTNYADVNAKASREKNILFVGRYNHMKGVDYLVEVIKKSHANCPDWRFTLFGEGDQKDWLLKELSANGLTDVVVVNEPTPNISREYQNAGIYILTSRNEGFPMVLLEAQAHGLPIISFDCETGPSEIISDHVDGFLIPTFDIETFVDKLTLLANDETLRQRMSQQAIVNRRRFSKDAIVKQWLEEFNSLS